MKKLFLTSSVLSMFYMLGIPSAIALTATGTVSMTASLAESCTVSTENMGFGQLAYGTGAAAQNFFKVDCLTGTVYKIRLDGGVNWDGSKRNMKNTSDGSSLIAYEILNNEVDQNPQVVTPSVDYISATKSDAAQTTVSVFTGIGQDDTFELWYTVDGAETTGKPTGTYSDTVTVVVTY